VSLLTKHKMQNRIIHGLKSVSNGFAMLDLLNIYRRSSKLGHYKFRMPEKDEDNRSILQKRLV